MILDLAAFLALSARCAPMVAPETMAAIVRTESGFNTLAIGVNGPYGSARKFRTVEDAAAFIAANSGASIDVGIAQINNRAGHMQTRGFSVAAALDPCIGLQVGGEVLAKCFRLAPSVDEQRRIQEAASCYNTGGYVRGFGNGYVQRVQASAGYVVPAIRNFDQTAKVLDCASGAYNRGAVTCGTGYARSIAAIRAALPSAAGAVASSSPRLHVRRALPPASTVEVLLPVPAEPGATDNREIAR